MARHARKNGKKFTEQARIERLGIALCNTLVSKMGHIWREKSVDYGIDGEIELIHDGKALNRVLWVQSKAKGDSVKFAGETDTSLRFTCDPDDLDYWLSGTAEVLLVCSHPESDQAWFKHLPSWFADPRRRRERVVEFDKERDRFDESTGPRLLVLGADSSSGVYLRPPPRSETLTTNLLSVDRLASHVYSAPTRCRTWTDVNAAVTKAGQRRFSDAVLRDGRIFTLRPLDSPQLSPCTNGAVERIATDELSDSADPNDQALLVWLLNGTLKDLFYRDLRFHPERKYLYFKALGDSLKRKVRVSNRSLRTVVDHYAPVGTATWSPYVRHMALNSQFVYLDGQWFLSLTPTYHYTSDGREDFRFGADQLSKMKRIEGHGAVRGQTKFWARYLAQGDNLFSDSADDRLRFGDLATVEVDRGIDDASWKPLSDDLELDGADSSDEQTSLFAALEAN